MTGALVLIKTTATDKEHVNYALILTALLGARNYGVTMSVFVMTVTRGRIAINVSRLAVCCFLLVSILG